MENMYSYRDLLAATICEKFGSYTLEEIFKRFSSPHELLEATEQELMEIRGIGKAKARQIVSTLQLAKMLNMPKLANEVIRQPQDVYELMRDEIGFAQKEFFYCLLLNTKNRVISKELISIGSLNSAIVHPREVFKIAIKRSSASIIAIHNHPSGDPTPSPEDIELTKRLVSAGSIIGVECLDHVIITGNNFVSLKEKGFM
jgi:DNA repair protein RadC